MSKINFQAKVKLVNVVDAGNGSWNLNLGFTDLEGTNTPYDVLVGDVVVLDTSPYEQGTVTHYVIEEILAKTFGSLRVTARPSEVVDPPLDLNWALNTDGIVTRPSENLGLLPVISADVQQTNDRLSFYTLNHNLINILDKKGAGSSGAVPSGEFTLYTAKKVPFTNGLGAIIPHTPAGDFVHDLALIYFDDGSMAELDNIVLFTDTDGFNYVRISEEDEIEYGAKITHLTVSYLVSLVEID